MGWDVMVGFFAVEMESTRVDDGNYLGRGVFPARIAKWEHAHDDLAHRSGFDIFANQKCEHPEGPISA